MTNYEAVERASGQIRFTQIQIAFLRFWRDYGAEHGYPPTIREAGARFDLSSINGVHQHCGRLIKKGALTRATRISRGLVLTDFGRDLCGPTGTVDEPKRCPCGLAHFLSGDYCFGCAKTRSALPTYRQEGGAY